MNPACKEIPEAPDDLEAPPVGSWALQKYLLLINYAQVFATATKFTWQERVYVDLFAGCGKATIRETGKVVPGSPCLALTVDDRFDRFVFCEKDPHLLSLLRTRAERIASDVQKHFIEGDVNEHLADLLAAIPRGSQEHKVLSFCFVDPFGFSGLHFDLIRSFAQNRFVDFLIHLPAGEALRNQELYLGESTIMDDFLGDRDWRTAWLTEGRKLDFDSFVARQFDQRTRKLGFAFSGSGESVFIRSTGKNLPLYRLGFYSRHKLGQKLWNAVKKCIDGQRELF